MTNEHSAGKDNILAFLVQATNKHNLFIDITLNVNGAIVTGTILSAKDYFVSLSETFVDGSEVAQQLSEKFAQAGEAIDSEDGGEASFIHLKDAKVFCGSRKSIPSKGEALWRGALSDINGFYLDNIPDSAEDDDEESDNGDYQSLKEKNSKLTDRIGKLEEMIAKLSPDNKNEDKSEDETESDEKQDSSEDTSNEDEEKEKSQKKRSGTKSGSTKTKKKASAKKTAKSE
ncbi:gas vesicle accessory protein GvpU [Sutcliffiella horikoshii]|uniref:gas vesicle accessory protein GvpU n=1 Tax=Sutcliffiella horikoshii TaxID=79883 RepID=UPI00384CDE52